MVTSVITVIQTALSDLSFKLDSALWLPYLPFMKG